MSRPNIPSAGELAERLLVVKMKVRSLKDAMPTMARELRQETCEELDEIIGALRAAT